MALNLPSLTRKTLAAVFRLGPPVVRAGVFYRPTGFNSSTGGMVATEVAAPCEFLGAHVLWGNYLV